MRPCARWMITLFAVSAAIPAVAGGFGFLDAERAIKTVKEGQRQYQALDAWANQKTDEVEALQNRVMKLYKQLETQRNVALDDALKRLEDDLLQAQRDLEDARKAIKYDFENEQTKLLAQVASRVRAVASDFAVANGIDAVFLLESQPMVYLADSVIITDAVIRLYDERYPID